jgi:hypothetical protein
MFGTQWWCWFAKWSRFWKNQNWYDLVSDLMLPLGLLILSNRKGIGQGGQHQNGSP